MSVNVTMLQFAGGNSLKAEEMSQLSKILNKQDQASQPNKLLRV
jgi:hypothetical protein